MLSSTTRLPNTTPYNTFTLTCTATAPMGVIESKTFTWRRTSGSGGSCGSFSEITDSGTLQITNSNVDQPVSTSVLTVTETTAAVWRYCCQATLFDGSGTSDEVAVTVTGEWCQAIILPYMKCVTYVAVVLATICLNCKYQSRFCFLSGCM